jgi:hypothetical protein
MTDGQRTNDGLIAFTASSLAPTLTFTLNSLSQHRSLSLKASTHERSHVLS